MAPFLLVHLTPMLSEIPLDRGQMAMALGPLGLVGVFQVAGWTLRRWSRNAPRARTVEDFLHRTRGWWWVAAFFAIGVVGGRPGVTLLMSTVTLLALREFFRALPGKGEDRAVEETLAFVGAPVAHGLAALAPTWTWQVALPAAVVLGVPVALAIRGECADFLGRVSRLTWAWLVCVWSPAFATALVAGNGPMLGMAAVANFFFVLFIVELSDVLQYVWGMTLGRHPILPKVSPKKTWEGLLGGVLTSAVIGAAIAPSVPLTRAHGALIAAACVVAGFLGGAVMSAVKRGLALKDYGTSLSGIGGVVDRLDSLCFAAPVGYALLRLLA